MSSRDRVLAVLRAASEPLPVADICARSRLSPTAARFHLDRLIGGGIVQVVKDPNASGAGRPALHYSAAPAEAVDPAAAYRALAGRLAAQLDRSAGPQAAADAGRAWAHALTDRLPVAGTDPVGVLMSVLENGGFRPARSADGPVIELHRCPFLDLALEQPAVVCALHLGLVSGVVERLGHRTPVRLVPALDDDSPCLVGLDGPGSSLFPAPAPTIERNAS